MSAQSLPDPTTVRPEPEVGPSGREPSTGTDHVPGDALYRLVGSGPSSLAPAGNRSAPVVAAPGREDGHVEPIVDTTTSALPARRDQDLLLYLYADQLGDVERLRIATENRLRSLFSDDDWGKGVPEDLPEAAPIVGQLDTLRALEHGITLSLKRAMRAHYLGAWCKATIGVGEKQLARLLACIGNPAWNERDDRPRRGPAELWAYCGLHVVPGHGASGSHTATAGDDPSSVGETNPDGTRVDGGHPTDHSPDGFQATLVGGVAPKRRKGQRANWSTEAKTRAYLIATSCIKQRRSPYRDVYDRRRAHTAVTHPEWTDGHSHNDALRIVSKALLKDLWREARNYL